MSLPTREQLHDEVDRRFAEQYPEAPTRLDPEDAAHASWIESWLAIRDEILHDWVDDVFARFFPDAGKLDPDDSADAFLVDYWLDIRDQIRDGVEGRYGWDGDPTVPAQLSVPSVTRDPAGGWVVRFDRALTVEKAQAYLWTSGTPDGVQVESTAANEVKLSGLSTGALQAMRPEVARQIQPSVLTSDPPPDGTTPTPPDEDVELDAVAVEKINEWLKHALEATHALGSVAEVTESIAMTVKHLAPHSKKAALFLRIGEAAAKYLGPVGYLATIIVVVYEVIDAFKSERRGSVKQGFVYGLMWEALDEPDHIPNFEPGITYSAEEHEEAFKAGIADGRAKAKDPVVRNKIILAVVSVSLSSGLGEYYAANEVLSALWRRHREPSPGDSDTDKIRWPDPYDRNPLVMQ